MTLRMAWLRDVPALWRREPMLTGRVGGVLYTGAGIYALLLLVLPGTTLTHARARRPAGRGLRHLRAAEHLRPRLAHAAHVGAAGRDPRRRW